MRRRVLRLLLAVSIWAGLMAAELARGEDVHVD